MAMQESWGSVGDAQEQQFAASDRRRHQLHGGYQDKPFALLFVANLVFTVVVFATDMSMEPHADEDAGNQQGTPDAVHAHSCSDDPNCVEKLNHVLLVSIWLAVVATVLSIMMVNVLKSSAESIIRFAFLTVIVLFFGSGFLALFVTPLFGLSLIACSLCGYAWYRSAQGRIAFASASLSTACAAVQAHPGTIRVAILAIIPQFAWALLWSLTAMAIIAHYADHDAARFYVAIMVVSIFWVSSVIKNVVHCTVAGAVGSWWFAGATAVDVVSDSLKRACTTSFGSICLGSLVVAILQAVRSLLSEERARSYPSLRCMLHCVNDSLKYFNKFAFVYISLYGMSFRDAGSETVALWQERGLDLVIADNLVDNVLFGASLALGFVCSAIAGLWTQGAGVEVSKPEVLSAVVFFGFIIGVVISMLVMAVIQSAYATVFVCWAEDPQALARSHPLHFQRLLVAWSEHHPQELGVMQQKQPGLYEHVGAYDAPPQPAHAHAPYADGDPSETTAQV